MTVAYGIDLGTTFTSIATVGNNSLGRVEVLKIGDEGDALESVVFLKNGSTRVEAWVGTEARAMAMQSQGQGVFVEMAKRSIGVVGAERRGWPVHVASLALLPHHISSLVLRKVGKEVSSLRPDAGVHDVVITHPYHFGDEQKQATRDAGQLAGLEVVDTLNEPTAAAIAYGIVGRGASGLYMVFDLGGGTLDVTIVELRDSRISVVGGDGDSQLGGFDWDRTLIDHFNSEFRKADEYFDLSRTTDETRHMWRSHAIQMKKQLSKTDVALALLVAEYDGETHRGRVEVTRPAFEAMTAYLVQRCRTRCETLLNRLNIRWGDLKDVLMVGGSTRMPMIREMVKRELGRPPRIEGFDPVTIVAQGAAIYASDATVRKAAEGAAADNSSDVPGKPILASGLCLPDVVDALSRGFGVGVLRRSRSEDEGDLFVDILAPQDTPTPYTCERVYPTVRDGQTEIPVPLYEGESNKPSECKWLGECVLRDLPPRPAGQEVKVVFEVERSGRKRVWVTDVATGRQVEQTIDRSGSTRGAEPHSLPAVANMRERLMEVQVI